MYRYFTYWQHQGLPGYGFVSLAWAIKPFHQLALDDAKRFGKVYGGYDPANMTLFLNDAKMARELCIKEFHKFPIRFAFHTGSTNIT